ncbi:uncharacterized protein LOC143887354 [Tasmannia lanceolata]|uniref:uncharacterized protein LOC143887354 n=1 Tax=Tasmannia lanceolata TaxID=3420 RepID=UPI004063BF2D
MDDSDQKEKLVIAAACAATACIAACYYEKYLLKEPRHSSTPSGHMWVNDVLNGNKSRCHKMFRMDKRVFVKLCDILQHKGLLRDMREVRIEEQVAIFLLTVGHDKRNRVAMQRFKHSGYTISRYFNMVLDAIVALAPDFFQLPDTTTAPEILDNPLFNPYFKDCIGAVDGTHIPAMVNGYDRAPFRNKKGFLSQNVMAACSFDLLFQFVLAGWEGSTADSRVLSSALTRPNGLQVPEGKYYLVDKEYANMPGFIAPYQGVRYQLSEFTSDHPPENAKELFNYRHSSLRFAIERSFGALKARFSILKSAPPYPFKTQVKIVLAACVLHNHIRKEKSNDRIFQLYEQETPPIVEDPIVEDCEDLAPETTCQQQQLEGASQLRDDIADTMWSDYLSNA